MAHPYCPTSSKEFHPSMESNQPKPSPKWIHANTTIDDMSVGCAKLMVSRYCSSATARLMENANVYYQDICFLPRRHTTFCHPAESPCRSGSLPADYVGFVGAGRNVITESMSGICAQQDDRIECDGGVNIENDIQDSLVFEVSPALVVLSISVTTSNVVAPSGFVRNFIVAKGSPGRTRG